MAILHKYCSKCGANIKGAQGICPSCGNTLSDELLYENIEQVGAGGIGYSDITDHESFKAYKKYTKKVQMIGLRLVAAFLIVVLIVTGIGPVAAVLTGIVIYILMLIIALLSGRKKPSWEGTVEKKRYHRRRNKNDSDKDIYTVVFRTDSGKKKSQDWTNNSVIYDYLTEGDRVRFLGNLGSPYAYEKYDKSNEFEIPCVSCGAKMDPRYDYCTTCGSILLKGKV